MATLISLCTTVRNRRSQFQATFCDNLNALSTCQNVEWIILDYGSSQNEFELFRKAHPPTWVHWVRMEAAYWHTPRAKNAAVHASTGDIVMNFDVDQRLKNAIAAAQKAGDRTLVHNWSGVSRDGTCGRIACSRRVFDRLGGYDEDFLPCGYDDLDLIARAAASGVKVAKINCGPNAAIPNTTEEAISDCRVEGVTWKAMEKANHVRSDWNIGMGILVANQRRWSRS
jgi:hypothetical protein